MKIIGILAILIWATSSFAQSHFIERLEQGEPQHIVVYGTSLSSGACGDAWMSAVVSSLSKQYGRDLITYTLAGKAGKWSTWGVQHLEDSVIAKDPDVVIMEFGINDAFQNYKTPVAVAQLNLEYMIDRVRLHNTNCEIILQVMNMPIGKSADYRPELEDYYAMYRETAQKKDVQLIDHYPNWQAILERGQDVFLQYIPDGIHPSVRAGREIVAPHILRCILQ